MCGVVCLMVYFEMGTMGRVDLSVVFVVCPLVLREGCQGKACLCGVVCLMVYFEMGTMGRLVRHVCSLSPGTPRGVPGEGLSVFM